MTASGLKSPRRLLGPWTRRTEHLRKARPGARRPELGPHRSYSAMNGHTLNMIEQLSSVFEEPLK